MCRILQRNAAWPAQVDSLPVLERTNGVIRLRCRAVADPRTGCTGHLQMSGEEVGVKVSVDDALDGQPMSGRVVEVLVDIASRIDKDGTPGGLVADQVGSLRQAVEVVLGEVHDASLGTDGSAVAGGVRGRGQVVLGKKRSRVLPHRVSRNED